MFKGEFSTRDLNGRLCPYYNKWQGMLERGYSESYKKQKPTYKDCYVSEYFKYFPNFKKWCLNYLGYLVDKDIRNYEIDKDLCFKGNKIYSESTCHLIPRNLNLMLTNRCNDRGDSFLGVCYHKRDQHYRASLSIDSKIINLGSFESEDDAFYSYKKNKEFHLKSSAMNYYKDGRITDSVLFLCNNYKISKED